MNGLAVHALVVKLLLCQLSAVLVHVLFAQIEACHGCCGCGSGECACLGCSGTTLRKRKRRCQVPHRKRAVESREALEKSIVDNATFFPGAPSAFVLCRSLPRKSMAVGWHVRVHVQVQRKDSALLRPPHSQRIDPAGTGWTVETPAAEGASDGLSVTRQHRVGMCWGSAGLEARVGLFWFAFLVFTLSLWRLYLAGIWCAFAPITRVTERARCRRPCRGTVRLRQPSRPTMRHLRQRNHERASKQTPSFSSRCMRKIGLADLSCISCMYSKLPSRLDPRSRRQKRAHLSPAARLLHRGLA